MKVIYESDYQIVVKGFDIKYITDHLINNVKKVLSVYMSEEESNVIHPEDFNSEYLALFCYEDIEKKTLSKGNFDDLILLRHKYLESFKDIPYWNIPIFTRGNFNLGSLPEGPPTP